MLLRPERLASYAALLIAGLVAAVSIDAGGFVPGGTDSSGYVSAADRWRAGEIYGPAPLHLWAAWPAAAATASPVAYRPALIRGADVSVYPLGFPVFSAAAVAGMGPLGAYLAAPLFGVLLAWCTFALARSLAGNWAGLIAAVLVAVTPVTLLHTIHPMSDVPAAACWALAWLMALRGTKGGAAASGAAVSAAVLIRPNLAPLAMVPGVLAVVMPALKLRSIRTWGWGSLAVFSAVAAVGPLVVAWSQAVLYGGPFVPGYVEWQNFYRVEHVASNLRMYPRLLIDLHSPLIFGGALALVPIWRRTADPAIARRRRAIGLSAVAFIVVNVANYLPYLSLDHWPFLRFLLPAVTALFVLVAASAAQIGAWLAMRSRWLTPIPLILVLPIVQHARPQIHFTLNDWFLQSRILIMGGYLREVLPLNAAVLSFVHSGAIRHYTGRQIVRLDLLDPPSLDRVVDDLTRHGYEPVFVLDEMLETPAFRGRFPQSRYGALDWAPRATFTTAATIAYYVAADRARYVRGQRWPIDRLR